MAYRKLVTDNLNRQFEEAEASGTCLTCGGSNKASKYLLYRLSSGCAIRTYSGLYARAEYWNGLTKREQMQHIIRSLSQMHPCWIFSHTSAAIMQNLEVPWSIYQPIHYQTTLKSRNSRNKLLVQHRVDKPVGLKQNGACITSVEQTVIDCAALLSFQQALPIADSALHLGLTSKAYLNSYLEARSNKRGARKAKHVIDFAEHLAENGGESAVRAVMIESGLPLPELQVQIANPFNCGHYYYVDFMFTRSDGVKVAFELDGREKYQSASMLQGRSSIDAMMDERQREAAITSQGIRVVRLGFADATNPAALLRCLAQYGIYPA